MDAIVPADCFCVVLEIIIILFLSLILSSVYVADRVHHKMYIQIFTVSVDNKNDLVAICIERSYFIGDLLGLGGRYTFLRLERQDRVPKMNSIGFP